jgi:hypothetical protein
LTGGRVGRRPIPQPLQYEGAFFCANVYAIGKFCACFEIIECFFADIGKKLDFLMLI